MDPLRESFQLALPRTRFPIVFGGILGALFLLAPILVIVPIAFTSGNFLRFPPDLFSTHWFETVLDSPSWLRAFGVSFRTAAAGALLATIAGTAAAFAVRRMGFGARLARTLFLAPIIIPQVLLALGLYVALRNWLGGSLWMLVLGQATLATPLVFVAVSAALSGVDPSLSRAAASLGFRWPSIVWRIELPLVSRSVVGGAIIAFGFCFDEAVVAYFLSPPGNETLPTRIWLSATESVSPAIAAVSVLVISITLFLLGVLLTIQGRQTAKGER